MPAKFTRREFVVGSLATGFAAAVLPVSAQTLIVTDSGGLDVADIKIASAGFQVPAYAARPSSAGPFPTVLVVHEIFGVHEHIKDVCRRLAKVGYLAIAPDLFARHGDVTRMSDVQSIISSVVAKTPDAQVIADLDATAGWAAQNHGAAAQLGVTGFCWGGRVVWLYAAHNPQLKAGVAWYGKLTGPSDALHPKQPVDLAAELKAPVLGLYGGADDGIPADTVEQMRTAIKAAGKIGEIVVYPNTPHAFHADYRPSYRADEAKDGWQRLLAWFDRYLKHAS